MQRAGNGRKTGTFEFNCWQEGCGIARVLKRKPLLLCLLRIYCLVTVGIDWACFSYKNDRIQVKSDEDGDEKIN